MSGYKLLLLVLLTIAMGVGSFIGGMVPIKLSMSYNNVNYFSFFGMGILIGTSLVLIIPEGVEVMYKSLASDELDLAPMYIGLSLILGFLLMFIQDNLPMLITTVSPNIKFNYLILEGANNYEPSIKDGLLSILQSPLTLGLILHAFIDGISLASSFALDNSSMGIIFFMIIIIHKIPTAFSLTSILIKESFHLKLIQTHLMVFSLMTPIGAIITYFIIFIFNIKNQFPIAILFLFSAGTFLYVIHHVMAEVASRSDPSTNHPDQTNYDKNSKLTIIEFAISLAGAFIPILLSLIGD